MIDDGDSRAAAPSRADESAVSVEVAERWAGRIVELAQSDYRYGIGTLRLRITGIAPSPAADGWLVVDGVRIDPCGVARERHTLAVRPEAVASPRRGPADGPAPGTRNTGRGPPARPESTRNPPVGTVSQAQPTNITT